MAEAHSDQSASLSAKSTNSTSGFWQWDHDRVEVILATIHPPQEAIWNGYKLRLILICVLLTWTTKAKVSLFAIVSLFRGRGQEVKSRLPAYRGETPSQENYHSWKLGYLTARGFELLKGEPEEPTVNQCVTQSLRFNVGVLLWLHLYLAIKPFNSIRYFVVQYECKINYHLSLSLLSWRCGFKDLRLQELKRFCSVHGSCVWNSWSQPSSATSNIKQDFHPPASKLAVFKACERVWLCGRRACNNETPCWQQWSLQGKKIV